MAVRTLHSVSLAERTLTSDQLTQLWMLKHRVDGMNSECLFFQALQLEHQRAKVQVCRTLFSHFAYTHTVPPPWVRN